MVKDKIFNITRGEVNVNGITKGINDDALISNNSSVIRFVSKNYVLVNPKDFETSAKIVFNGLAGLKYAKTKHFQKAYVQAVYFDFKDTIKHKLIDKLQAVVYHSYTSDFNLGVGLNVIFKDGTEITLTDAKSFPNIRKFINNEIDGINRTLNQFNEAMFDIVTNKAKKTLEFFKTTENNYNDTEAFIHAFYTEKLDTSHKGLSYLLNIGMYIDIATASNKKETDGARMYGLLKYFYEYQRDNKKTKGQEYTFFNRSQKEKIWKISQFIWK